MKLVFPWVWGDIVVGLSREVVGDCGAVFSNSGMVSGYVGPSWFVMKGIFRMK